MLAWNCNFDASKEILAVHYDYNTPMSNVKCIYAIQCSLISTITWGRRNGRDAHILTLFQKRILPSALHLIALLNSSLLHFFKLLFALFSCSWCCVPPIGSLLLLLLIVHFALPTFILRELTVIILKNNMRENIG